MIVSRSTETLFLINAVVQIPLLFGTGMILSRIARKSSPELHYRLWVGVLLAQVLFPVLGAVASRMDSRLLAWTLALCGRGQTSSGGVTTLVGPLRPLSGLSIPSWVLTSALWLYLALTAWRAAHLLLDLWKVRRLRAEARTPVFPPEIWEQWHTCCAALGVDLGMAPVPLLLTSPGNGMMTIGCRNPVVLVPSGLLPGLSAEDRASSFAHECAHIQRNDYAWNLLFHCISLAIGFHPLTGHTLRRIAEAREMVCDERAAQAVSGRQRYAKSLVRLAEALLPAQAAPTLNAIGFLDANTLERRLMRLHQKSSALGRKHLVAMACTAVVALTGTWTTASALHLGVRPTTEQTSGASPAAVPVASGIEAGNVLTHVHPVYPPEARKARISGSVVLKAVIDERGTVADLQVLSGPPELAPSALEAVRQWIYKPYLLNGQPTAVETTITVNYNLQ